MTYVLLYCGRCPWTFPANASSMREVPFLCPRCLTVDLHRITAERAQEIAVWFESRGMATPPWVLEAMRVAVHAASYEGQRPEREVRTPQLQGEEDGEDDIPRDD